MRNTENYESFVPGSDKLTRQPDELAEKKENTSRGLEFENAFGRDKEVVSPETDEVLCLRDLALYLASGKIERKGRYYEPANVEEEDRLEREGHDAMRMRELLLTCPIEPEVIRQRQDFIAEILEHAMTDNQGLDKFRSQFAYGAIDFDFARGFSTVEQWEKNIERIEYCAQGKILDDARRMLSNFKGSDFTSSYAGQFITELEQVIPKLEKKVEELRDSPFLNDSRMVLEYQLAGQDEVKENAVLAKMKAKSWSEYRETVDDIGVGGQEFAKLNRMLTSLDSMLFLASIIKARNLSKQTILHEENSVDLHELRNPFLVAKLGLNKVVAADVAIPEEKSLAVTGDNATGKSKLVDAVALNTLMAQTCGYGFAKDGKISPREKIGYLTATQVTPTETEYSTGQKELENFIKTMDSLPPRSLIVLDEVLRSTDATGALALVIAVLENKAEQGLIALLTIHSRDLEIIDKEKLAPSFRCLKAIEAGDGKPTYKWEEGVGRADPIRLAESLKTKLPESVLKRARDLYTQIEEKQTR